MTEDTIVKMLKCQYEDCEATATHVQDSDTWCVLCCSEHAEEGARAITGVRMAFVAPSEAYDIRCPECGEGLGTVDPGEQDVTYCHTCEEEFVVMGPVAQAGDQAQTEPDAEEEFRATLLEADRVLKIWENERVNVKYSDGKYILPAEEAALIHQMGSLIERVRRVLAQNPGDSPPPCSFSHTQH